MSHLRYRAASVALVACTAIACGGEPTDTQTSAASSAPPAKSVPPAVSSPPAVVSASPDKATAQHVLIAYKGAKGAPKSVTRSKADAKKLAEEVQKKATGGADFAELAKQYSEDEDSKGRSGSVGTVARNGNKVKPFEDAVFALGVDGVSPVVETEFGFHVIKRNQ